MITLRELAQKLNGEKSVAIFCHVRPDGDAIGSACALKNALESIGINAKVFCDDDIPQRFSYIVSEDDLSREDLSCEYDAFVAVDSAEISRLGKYALDFGSHKNTFNIDHHISNPRYAKVNYVCDTPANVVNVYNLIPELKADISEKTANLLAMGLMTDTGNFTHQNVDANAFALAGELVKLGANQNTIYYHNFKKQTKQRAKLFGMVMSKLRYFHSDRLVVAPIMQKDLQESGAHQSETEGFVDFLMGIDTVEVGACVMEIGKDKYKISLRSKGANVNAVASDFGGGGHILASGCQVSAEYEEVIDRLAFSVSKQLND